MCLVKSLSHTTILKLKHFLLQQVGFLHILDVGFLQGGVSCLDRSPCAKRLRREWPARGAATCPCRGNSPASEARTRYCGRFALWCGMGAWYVSATAATAAPPFPGFSGSASLIGPR